MHGREGEDRRRNTYMQPTPLRPSTKTLASPSGENSCQKHGTCFLKDGRKIHVGDCALFQAQGSPPFIGLIHCLTLNKENHHKLFVNWLYRPADVKIGKSILFDVAPNEVFYSFHRDEISADFLLHPCKVAFLPKGVDLPPGISSFVCRRVYDTENKCLWWLTDKGHINEWKEQADKLLDKTWVEMYAEGRSLKTLNSPSSQQLKSGSDSVPNSSTSFPSQIKGKKRERGDQGLEPIKHDRSSKNDDLDSGHMKSDSMIKLEVSKLTDKDGGLVNSESVERFVQLMQPHRFEKKIDLAGRIVLANVISTTNKVDCLSRFVQLKGLSVLDDWLQEAHKGKAGDQSSQRDGDKDVEDLLLALLRALDKLPVNLLALKSCNIGKSVNHLRTHKNFDIHKKAKCLVDTWKKRVDAEMKINEEKSGSSLATSWPGKSSFSEPSHCGSKRTGPSDVSRSAVLQSSANKTSNKFGQGHFPFKCTLSSPNSTKLSQPMSVTNCSNDSCIKVTMPSETSDPPFPTIKEENAGNSIQSPNDLHSCSIDLAKVAGFVCREDSRSTTAVSMNAKTSGGSSRQRRSSNGFVASSPSLVQRESSSEKQGSANRNIISEKASQSGPPNERTTDPVTADHPNNQRLIVRLPNPGRSPGHHLNGVPFDDTSVVGSRTSSPRTSDKHEHYEQKLKVKADVAKGNLAINIESGQGNDVKDGLSGSDNGEKYPVLAFDDEGNTDSRDAAKALGISKAPNSSSAKQIMISEPKYVSFYDMSCSSMNALVESCAQYSEIPTLSNGDDLGMNLLASVAAGEMCKSYAVSPNASPVRSSSLHEDSNNRKPSKSQSSHENIGTQDPGQQDEIKDDKLDKQGNDDASSKFREDPDVTVTDATSHCLEDRKTSSDTNDKSRECENLCTTPERKVSNEGSSAELTGNRIGNVSPMESAMTEEHKKGSKKRKTSVGERSTEVSMNAKNKGKSPSASEMATIDAMLGKLINSSIPTSDILHRTLCDVITEISHQTICNQPQSVDVRMSIPSIPSEIDAAGKKMSPVGGPSGDASNEASQACAVSTSLDAKDASDNSQVLGSCNVAHADEQVRTEKPKEMNCDATMMVHAYDQVKAVAVGTDARVVQPTVPTPNEIKDKVDTKFIMNQHSDASPPSSEILTEQVKVDDLVAAVPPESSLAAAGLQSVRAVDSASKIEFDLNEGFLADDGNHDEHATSQQSITVPYSVSPVTIGGSVSITIAAAVKGSFTPPENMLHNKVDMGWKGSAATSAFRPTEPRKVLEVLISSPKVPSSNACTSKQSRAVLDIDLNEPDQRVLEDLTPCSLTHDLCADFGLKPLETERFSSMSGRSAGFLDLDLNRVDEPETVQSVGTSTQKLEVSLLSASRGPSSGRDFDLNNGPGPDEGVADRAPCCSRPKSSSGHHPPVTNLKMNELGNISSWLPPAGPYSQLPVLPFVSDRIEQPYSIVAAGGGVQRIVGSSIGGPATFGADMYRPPVLSSPPTIVVAAQTHFPSSGFPFGGGFPLAPTSFPASSTYTESSSGSGLSFAAAPPQLVGANATLSAPYGRPYLISHPDGSGWDTNHKWVRQGLDLNAGPVNNDTDAMDHRLTAMQYPQALSEDHMRFYQAAGGSLLKRKEPEGGWDADRVFGSKQPWL